MLPRPVLRSSHCSSSFEFFTNVSYSLAYSALRKTDDVKLDRIEVEFASARNHDPLRIEALPVLGLRLHRNQEQRHLTRPTDKPSQRRRPRYHVSGRLHHVSICNQGTGASFERLLDRRYYYRSREG